MKQRAVELARSMEKEDGVTGAVKAFFRHYPHQEAQTKPETNVEAEPSTEPSRFFSIRRCFGCS